MSTLPGAGGSRMSSGHNFQQNITTWALSHMLLQIQGRWQSDFGLAGNLTIERVSCESDSYVDDINLEFTGGRVVYGQCKTSVHLSQDINKELGSAIAQFYRQFAKNRSKQEEYRLVLFCENPSKPIKKLTDILNRYRFLSNDSQFHEAALGEHKKIVDTFNNLLTSLEERPGIANLNIDRQEMLRLMYIVEIHHEGAQSYRYDIINNLQSLLHNPNDADRTLKELILLAGELMKRRGTRDRFALLRHLEQLSVPVKLRNECESRYASLRENYIRDFDNNIENNSNIIGRESVFAAIETFFSNRQRGYFCIEASAGLGKTSIAAAVTRQYDALHFFASIQQNFTRAPDCLKHLCASVIIRFQLPYYDLPDRAGESHDYLNKLLKEAMAKQRNTTSNQMKPLYIVVDALDEFDSPLPGRPFLSLPENLPEGVFFVLTYRPGTRLPQLNKIDAECYSMEDHFQDHLNTIRSYLLYKASTSEIQQALAQMPPSMSTTEFVSQLEDASEGNFMYLRYVLDDFVDHRKSDKLLDLRSLPKGLQAYYQHIWEMMQSSAGRSMEDWEKIYLPVITLLAAAGEPVDMQWLVDQSGLKPNAIHRALQRWQPFLRTKGSDSSKMWHLVHQSFAEFLKQHEYLLGNHQTIADYYLNECARWASHSGYAHRHLSMHLRSASQYNKLFTLVDDNSWKQSQLNTNSSSIYYLNDLAHAWSVAELTNAEAFQHQQTLPLLPRELRCAIASAELRSSTKNIPPALLKALVCKEVWTYSRAFEAVRQISDPVYASKAFVAITDCIQRISSREELEFALSLPEQVMNETLCPRGTALTALAKYLPEEQLSEVLKAIFAIQYVRGRYTALTELVPYLSHAMLVQLQEFSYNTAQDEDNSERVRSSTEQKFVTERGSISFSYLALLEDFRDKLTTAISIRFAQLKHYDKAFIHIRRLKSSYWQIEAIEDLATFLPNDLQQELINLIGCLTKASDRETVLLKLIEHVPNQLLLLVLNLLRNFDLTTHSNQQTQPLSALTSPYIIRILEDGWKIIQNGNYVPYIKEKACIALFSRMAKAGFFYEALYVTRLLPDGCIKARILHALDIGLLDLRDEEFEALTSCPDLQWNDAQLLGHLAKQWSPALLNRAFHRIITIENKSTYADFLVNLAPSLKKALASTALAVALKMENRYCLSILIALIPQLDIISERQLSIKRVIQNIKSDSSWFFPSELVELAIRLTDEECILILRATFEFIKTKEGYYQVREINRIAHLLPQFFLPEVLEVIEALSDYWCRKSVIETLAPYISSKKLLLKSLKIVSRFDDLKEQSNLHLALASFFAEKNYFQDCLRSITSIKMDEYTLQALTTLAKKIPITYQEQLLQKAFSIKNPDQQAEAFLALIPTLPEDVLPLLIATVSKLEGPLQPTIINELNKRLPNIWLVEAIQQWSTISDAEVRFRVFIEIIDRFPSSNRAYLLNIALAAARSIDVTSYHAAASHKFWALHYLLSYFSESKQLDIFNDMRRLVCNIDPQDYAPTLVKFIEISYKFKHTPTDKETLRADKETLRALFSLDEKHLASVFLQFAQNEIFTREVRYYTLRRALAIIDHQEGEFLSAYQLTFVIQLLPPDNQLFFFKKALDHIRTDYYESDLENINILLEQLKGEVKFSARRELLQVILDYSNLGRRAYSLTIILPILSDSERKSAIQDIWKSDPSFDRENDAKVIEKLLICLPLSERYFMLNAGIDVASGYIDSYKKTYILIALTTLLPEEERERVLPDIIQAMSKIEDTTNLTEVIIAIVPLLQFTKSRPLNLKVFSIAEKITSQQERWKAYLALSACESNKRCQCIIQQILDESRGFHAKNRFRIFLPVMDKIPVEESISLFSNLIDNAMLLEEDKYSNLDTWSDLGGSSFEEHPRTQELTRIILQIPPALIDKILLVTRGVDDSSDQSAIMKQLVLRTKQVDPNKLYNVWNEGLHSFSLRARAEVFEYLKSIIPILFMLGGIDSLRDLHDVLSKLS